MPNDVLIVGGGPAGMTAALYALRAGKSVVVIEKAAFGGQIADSPLVENIPSLKSISGLEYSNQLFEQISDLGVAFEMDDIKSVEKLEEGRFVAHGEYGDYEAKSIIIAAGCKHRKLNVPGEDTFLGHGVSYCAVCDGAFYEGKTNMVIGDGNSALVYALSLSDISKKVYVCTLFDRFFGEESNVKALLKRDNVEVIHDVASKELLGDSDLKTVVFSKKDGSELRIDVSGCFVAIGHVPDNQRFEGLVRLDQNGFVLSDEAMATSTKGVFVAGDCRQKKYRQVTTAASDGAIAALSAVEYLNSLEAQS